MTCNCKIIIDSIYGFYWEGIKIIIIPWRIECNSKTLVLDGQYHADKINILIYHL